MSERYSTREAIRRALQYAIMDRTAFIDANAHTGDETLLAETRAEISAFRKVLKRRYGTRLTGIESSFEGAKLVSIEELRMQSHTEDGIA